MTQYNSLNVKLSNLQLNKLKSGIKNEIEIVLRLPPNMIGDSNHEANFPHELLLTPDKFLVFVKLFQITHQLILNFKDIEDLIKIIKSLEDSEFLLKGVTESVQNEVKEQKGGFFSMLLATLGASLFNWKRNK